MKVAKGGRAAACHEVLSCLSGYLLTHSSAAFSCFVSLLHGLFKLVASFDLGNVHELLHEELLLFLAAHALGDVLAQVGSHVLNEATLLHAVALHVLFPQARLVASDNCHCHAVDEEVFLCHHLLLASLDGVVLDLFYKVTVMHLVEALHLFAPVIKVLVYHLEGQGVIASPEQVSQVFLDRDHGHYDQLVLLGVLVDICLHTCVLVVGVHDSLYQHDFTFLGVLL